MADQIINEVNDLETFEDSITQPVGENLEISDDMLHRIRLINPLSDSINFGCDLFVQVLQILSISYT